MTLWRSLSPPVRELVLYAAFALAAGLIVHLGAHT